MADDLTKPNPTRHAAHRTITNPFCYRQPITNYAVCIQVSHASGNKKLNQKNPDKPKPVRVQKTRTKKNPVKHKLYGVCTMK